MAAPPAPPGAHVVGAGEAQGAPALWLAEGGAARPMRLEGPFDLHVSGPRACIGSWRDGRRVPCPAAAPVGAEARCPACSGLERPECVFEPLCQAGGAGCVCAESFRGVEHLVYCAFFGTLPKVGMTQARRAGTRLREQGADLWFVVARGLDRAAARQAERAASMLYRVPEHRSHREVLPQLARPVPWDLAERRAQALRERLAGRFPVEPDLHRVADYPVRQPLPGRPRRVAPHGRHRGHWLGGKGSHLFYGERGAASHLDTGLVPVAAVKGTGLLGLRVRVADGGDAAGECGLQG